MVAVEPQAVEHRPLLDAYAAIRCEVRLQHSLDRTLPPLEPRSLSEAEQLRIDAGLEHEASVLRSLSELLGDEMLLIDERDRASAQRLTVEALDSRVPVVGRAWLPADEAGSRRGRPDLLIACSDGYLPVEIKLHLLTRPGSGSLERSPLEAPFPERAQSVEERRLRGAIWSGDALQLAHYYRMLEAMGRAGQVDGLLGGVIDGTGSLWWIDLDTINGSTGRSSLAAYDELFADRKRLAFATLRRNDEPGLPRPSTPWFHKECERCNYAERCIDELESIDDVSLVRWSSTETLARLRSAGVETRRALAALDLRLVDLGERLEQMSITLPQVLALIGDAPEGSLLDDVVGRRMGVRRQLAHAGLSTVDELLDSDAASLALAGRVRELGRLVRRARAHVGGGVLLQVPAEELESARADVEVDIDMESCDHASYLWGAYVTLRVRVEGVQEGYQPFVSFEPLDEALEAAVFGDFWSWFSELRALVRAQGLSFRAYCFWRPAEETQMKRAAAVGGAGLPSIRELERFFSSGEWVDLHQLAKDQLLTEGPLGLKPLATRAGFSWRDEDPSGEASVAWYLEAVGDDPIAAAAARARLLAYNEDDVLATRALRVWLDGPARDLPHVDEVLPEDR
jgi:predicted RecB family nuclease